LANKRHLEPSLLFAALQVMPISWMAAADYDDQRGEAKRRVGARDADDWPSVALALATGLPVWSQDKDFSVAGVDVYTTGTLLNAVHAAGYLD
jgi:predicted nucleic acid-binding protein